MKREIRKIHPKCADCCPGHDTYPNDTYSNVRSKRARSKGKKKEHREVRRNAKHNLKEEVINVTKSDIWTV